MFGFLAANAGTIVVLLVLAAVVGGIIMSMVKTHRAGGSCTCGCAGCSCKGGNCSHCAGCKPGNTRQ